MEAFNLTSREVNELAEKLEDAVDKLENFTARREGYLNGERYLTNTQLCSLLHISRRALQEYRNSGLIPYLKLGGKILYRESDLKNLLEMNYQDRNQVVDIYTIRRC